MANSYYTPTGNPLTRSVSVSSQMRTELASIQGAFDKLPNPYGGATKGFNSGTWLSPLIVAGTLTTCTISGYSVTVDRVSTSNATGTDYTSPFNAFGADAILGLYRINGANISAGIGVGGASMTSHYLLFDKYANVLFGDGTAAKATTATDGFLMIPTCAGPPTGVPAHLYSSSVPIIYDSTNNKLYVYDGSWLATAALT